jgi:protein-tyrosine kinase
MDADLRKPGVGRLLNMTDGKYAGLSSYLAGVSSLELVTVPHPAIPNLVVIPTGPLPPNPADLLSSNRLADALRQLRSQHKFIVIDSPPIMAATDAVILSVQADGVLLVVRSGETPKEAFTRAKDLLASATIRIRMVMDRRKLRNFTIRMNRTPRKAHIRAIPMMIRNRCNSAMEDSCAI